MKKIIEYTARTGTAYEVSNTAMTLIELGWQPYGPPCAWGVHGGIVQAFVIYETITEPTS